MFLDTTGPHCCKRAKHAMLKSRTTNGSSELAIFARLLGMEKGDFPPALARYILSLGFDEDDRVRMETLATKNQEGRLSPTDSEVLHSYVKAGHLLALLHSKARKSLKKRKVS